MGDEVQIAAFIRLIQVDGRRRHLITQGQHTEDRFDCTSSAEQMAGHRLGRTDRQLVGLLAEYPLHRTGLSFVASQSRGAVGVDVLHLIGVKARVAQGIGHATGRTIAIFRW